MSLERQQVERQKVAAQKFFQAFEKDSSLFEMDFSKKLFSYLMASWGLSVQNRSLLLKLFVQDIKKEIEKFCSKNRVHYDYNKISQIMGHLLSDEVCLQADTFVRRLFLHCLNSHRHFSSRFLYRFPEQEQKEILASQIAYLKKNNHASLVDYSSIINESDVVKNEFMEDINQYGSSHSIEMDYIKYIWGVTAFFCYQYFCQPLVSKHIEPLAKYGNKNKTSTLVLQIFIGLMLAYVFIRGVIQNLHQFEDYRRWSNFSEIDKLPDEFKNFIDERSQEIKEMLFSRDEKEKPEKLQNALLKQDKSISSPVSSDYGLGLSTQSYFSTKKSKIPKSPKNIKNSSSSCEKSEANVSNSVTMPTQKITWNYLGEVSYSPKVRRSVIQLWNNTMPYLNDYIFWETSKIKKAIGDFCIYSQFFIKAWDGHRIKVGSGEGFEKEGNAYRLRILGKFVGDKRLRFEEVAKSVDPVSNKTAHLYTCTEYVPKHDSAKVIRV